MLRERSGRSNLIATRASDWYRILACFPLLGRGHHASSPACRLRLKRTSDLADPSVRFDVERRAWVLCFLSSSVIKAWQFSRVQPVKVDSSSGAAEWRAALRSDRSPGYALSLK